MIEKQAINTVVLATVLDVKKYGMIVELKDTKKQAWLPLREINPNFKHTDEITHSVGKELKVKILGKMRETKGSNVHIIVSLYRVDNDPWDKTKQWVNGDIKRIRLTSITKTSAFGEISGGVDGFIRFAEIDEFFKNQGQKSVEIQAGDYLAGYVKSINSFNRLVELDVVSFIKNLNKDLIYFHNPGKVKQFFSDPELDLNTETEDYSQDIVLPNVARVLIVEDDPVLLEYFSNYIKESGITIKKAINEREALSIIKDSPDFDFAIIDVDLSGTNKNDIRLSDNRIVKSQNSCEGLNISKYLNKTNINCPILLISGQEVGLLYSDFSSYNQILISGFLHKPFSLPELRCKMIETLSSKKQTVGHFFKGISSINKTLIESINSDYSDEIDDIKANLTTLYKKLKADIVCLFSIHKHNFVVRLEYYKGSHRNFNEFRFKLRYSPVKDVAIDKETIYEHFIDESTLPKHRYLHKAFSYKSCIGVPVGCFSKKEHCLFVFFDRQLDEHHSFQSIVDLTSEKISAALERNLSNQQRFIDQPFILAGKSYGIMGHELGTILTTQNSHIQDINEVLFDENKRIEERLHQTKKILSKLEASNKRSFDIIKAFRNMVKGHKMEIEIIDIKNAIIHSARLIANELDKSIEIEFDDQIPEKATIEGKKTTVEQLFFNIINNAAQQIYLFRNIRSSGKILIQIKEVHKETRPYIKTLIFDTGPGIHASDFENIFQTGFTTREEDGLGLGLDIVRMIAREMSGSVKVLKSTLFVGTVFDVMLPVAQTS